ncbi:MAG: rhodanese-like domain-containing protein [Gammaproteobacteria bacterium]|nr:rhodanese-like domain-containing protein [Gammaproteobacteria bacterium]
MAQQITVDSFRTLFGTDEEFAVIDPRPRERFVQNHLLAASNLTPDRFETELAWRVPRTDTRCVLVDDGGEDADAAAAKMSALGYDQVEILAGGVEAWRASGAPLFSGSSVPGKAFGEFIEKSCATPSITAAEFARRRETGSAPLLIDSRTREEHESYCIPGAVLCPGAELVYRVLPHAGDGREIVVHCGGRTRSIVGAQTLIDAGLENVCALENGTMAWQFEGFELEQGNDQALASPAPAQLGAIQERARAMAETWYIDRVSSIPAQEVRTRYLIDVRGRDEYENGHIRGSLHVPGGHLLQNVDRYLLVRNAIVILIDGDRVRAITTAIWLRRMGWRRVFVFSLDDDKSNLEFGPGPLPSPLEDRDLDPADHADAEELLARNRAYLEWEIGLIDQLPGEPSATYIERA